MPSSTPTTPSKASYRLMKSLLGSQKQKCAPTPKELDRVSEVFRLAGGSWERVFKGSVTDLNLLKKTIKVAIETGAVTKALKWV